MGNTAGDLLAESGQGYANNLVPALRIIDACAKAKIKLIFVSSGGAVYGNTHQPRIAETHETNPISPYGIEKLMAEKVFIYVPLSLWT